MAHKPRSSRRALIYVMIPMGFVLMVIFLVFGGWFRAEVAEDYDTAPLEVPAQSGDVTGETGDAEPDEAVIDEALTDAAEPQTPDDNVRPSVADSDSDELGEPQFDNVDDDGGLDPVPPSE